MNRILKLSAILTFALLTGCNQNKILTTKVKVEGGTIEGYTDGQITIFKGIPFAAPPVGELRWKAPQPVIPWDNVRKTVDFGPSCPQMTWPGQKGNFSEDCLYLNVWTPAKKTDEKLPVMVWIYGGGFAMGSTAVPVYTGEEIAKKGVIMVSVAYRVGPLGFMAHPELTAESENHVSGNYGLLDQIAGLRWIQNNIASFGGDPNNVTIFGESAGAISVSMLAASPLTRGIIHKAISESGGSFWPVNEKKETDCIGKLRGGEDYGIEFAKRMGVNSLAEMRKLSPEKLLADPSAAMGGFWPLVDGYVITDDQYKLYSEGSYNDIPVMIGTNSDEGSMFVRSAKSSDYLASLPKRFGPLAEKIEGLYPGDNDESALKSMADIFRETAFAWPTWAWARLQTKTGKSPVYFYYFDQPQPGMPAPYGDGKPRGAYHSCEMQYVFHHLDQNPGMANKNGDNTLSDYMISYWTNFAKSGNPNGEGLAQWPVFSEEKESTMYLDSIPHTGPVPNIEKLKAMDEYFTWRRENVKQ